VVRVILLLVTFAFAGSSLAQDTPDLLGRWAFEISLNEQDERCGEKKTVGEMQVTKKITARAFRGSTTAQTVAEKCGVVGAEESGFTMRVKGNNVSIEYDKEGWSSETLVLDGDTLSGFDANGTPMEFSRQAEEQMLVSEEELAGLNEFLAELAPEVTLALRQEFGQKMLQNLRRTGLSREESIQVATETLERMTECVLDLAREDLAAQSLPLQEILAGKNPPLVLQPQNIDYREIECINAAAQKAGVVIR